MLWFTGLLPLATQSPAVELEHIQVFVGAGVHRDRARQLDCKSPDRSTGAGETRIYQSRKSAIAQDLHQ